MFRIWRVGEKILACLISVCAVNCVADPGASLRQLKTLPPLHLDSPSICKAITALLSNLKSQQPYFKKIGALEAGITSAEIDLESLKNQTSEFASQIEQEVASKIGSAGHEEIRRELEGHIVLLQRALNLLDQIERIPQQFGVPDRAPTSETIAAPPGMTLRIERTGPHASGTLIFEVPNEGIIRKFPWNVARAEMLDQNMLLVSAVPRPGQRRFLTFINLKDPDYSFDADFQIAVTGNPETNQAAYWVQAQGSVDTFNIKSGNLERFSFKNGRSTLMPIKWLTENHQIADFEPLYFTPSAHDPNLVFLAGNSAAGERLQIEFRYFPHTNAIEASVVPAR